MYVPLRVHSHHSLLTGVDPPSLLVERAAHLKLPALAMTDVDSLSGLVEFLRAGDALDSPPRAIVGAELSDSGGRPGRLVALVRDAQGYKNLCHLISARHRCLPEELGEKREGELGDFCLVDTAAEHHEGLVFLADHPRLLLGLFGHIPAERLFAAVSPASVLQDGRRAPVQRRARRNTHLHPVKRRVIAAESGASLQTPQPTPSGGIKCPSPQRPVLALTLVDVARAVGVATLAVPDVYHAFPGGAEDHRLRTAVKYNALLQDLPQEWLATQPAHLPTFTEMCALYSELPEVPGPWAEESSRSSDDAVPGAVARTLRVAESCRYTPPLGEIHFPEVELKDGETPYSKLCTLTFEGARGRYRPFRPEVLSRLEYELSTLHHLGYAPYFLLVHGISAYARERGIPCVGRGSAANSLVAFCLGLTDADPFRYHLPFERFLNPERRDRPDVDLDFCWRRRDEVLEHVYELFGDDRTAMICTLNRFGMRSAFREAALAHGIPPAEINPWSSRLPHTLPAVPAPGEIDAEERTSPGRNRPEAPTSEEPWRHCPVPSHEGGGGGGHEETQDEGENSPTGRSGAEGTSASRGTAADTSRRAGPRTELPGNMQLNPMAAALRSIPEARDFPFEDERFRRALDAAASLLDAPRHFGLHPGGVVVAPAPLTEFVPCQRAAKPHPTRGHVVVTQLDKDGVEAIGLVKMDLLGNRALTTIDDCLKILLHEGVTPNLEDLPEEEVRTAMTLSTGQTLGCFQIESPGMRNLLQQSAARCMDDVIRAVALIRPGPAGCGMKDSYIRRVRGLEDPTPPHPRLGDVLRETHGVMLYQEDVMQAAARVAGMELAEADQLRRALQKRRYAEISALHARFMAGCTEQGASGTQAEQIWDLIANFSSFAFCKAHAVTYGRIAYRAAWLKTHHPAAFLIAFLASDTGYYPQRVYVEEARRLGVPILPPDVNRSENTFSAEPLQPERGTTAALALRVGLAQVHGLSAASRESILEKRQSRGPFLSLPDLLDRTDVRTDEVETLIECGSLDTFDRTRPELLWRLHLLRAPHLRPPRHANLDPRQLQAGNNSPQKQAQDSLRSALAHTHGWSGAGIGVERAELWGAEEASLFPQPEAETLVLPGLPDPPALERARREYDLLGFSISCHPVHLFPCPADERLAARFGHGPRASSGAFHSSGSTADPHPTSRSEPGLRPVNPIPCSRIRQLRKGRVTLRGWPAATRRMRTIDGKLMRFLTLEDESGLAEAILFPDIYERDGHRLNEQGVLCVTGVIEEQLGACTLHVERIW